MANSKELSQISGPSITANSQVTPQAKLNRVASIDIFRGLTMVVMIFVNQIADMKGLPWWTYHMPGSVNGMTYVDMVFPFFLFIVGMSIPLATSYRISKGDSEFDLWKHVAFRSFGLILLGVILANSEKVDSYSTGIGGRAWTFIALSGAILFWNSYPRSLQYKSLFKALKFSGAVLMAAMLVIFRRVSNNGQVTWLDFSYWEILGMIGWTYLGVCIFYLPTRRWRWAALAWFVALSALNIFCAAHWITFAYRLPFYLWPIKSGAGASMVMVGIVTSTFFLSDAFTGSRKRKTIWALTFTTALFAAAGLLTPFGVSKLRATPTYCLICAGAAIVSFLSLYWICDVRSRIRWATFARPAGSNTLLTYLLPTICVAVFGRAVLVEQWSYGWFGVMQAALFTAAIVTLSAILSRLNVRIQL
jgi:heparan-alpha-glucosaminide N-acetyltransferase